MHPSRSRSEWKYLLHHSARPLLLERWRRYLVKGPFTDENAVSPVLSQYYDSPHLDFYFDKVDGFGPRHKVRLRTYGLAFTPGAPAWLEIKHRGADERITKYRHRIAALRPEHLRPAGWRIDDPEMEAAFQSLNERYRLRASAQTYYQRESYQGAVEEDLRITFDSVLRGLHPGEAMSRELLHDGRRSLMPDTFVILEIKSTREVPGWVHEGVVASQLERMVIPKYVTAVEVLGMLDMNVAGVFA